MEVNYRCNTSNIYKKKKRKKRKMTAVSSVWLSSFVSLFPNLEGHFMKYKNINSCRLISSIIMTTDYRHNHALTDLAIQWSQLSNIVFLYAKIKMLDTYEQLRRIQLWANNPKLLYIFVKWYNLLWSRLRRCLAKSVFGSFLYSNPQNDCLSMLGDIFILSI